MAAVPCDGYCKKSGSKNSCGSHINKWYKFDDSDYGYTYDCHSDSGCRCTDGTKCKFYQGYMEGSSYEGFMVKDKMYFGDEYTVGQDGFDFTFGCVSKETKLFYDQDADGILGLGMGTSMSTTNQVPIYDAMFN